MRITGTTLATLTKLADLDEDKHPVESALTLEAGAVRLNGGACFYQGTYHPPASADQHGPTLHVDTAWARKLARNAGKQAVTFAPFQGKATAVSATVGRTTFRTEQAPPDDREPVRCTADTSLAMAPGDLAKGAALAACAGVAFAAKEDAYRGVVLAAGWAFGYDKSRLTHEPIRSIGLPTCMIPVDACKALVALHAAFPAVALSFVMDGERLFFGAQTAKDGEWWLLTCESMPLPRSVESFDRALAAQTDDGVVVDVNVDDLREVPSGFGSGRRTLVGIYYPSGNLLAWDGDEPHSGIGTTLAGVPDVAPAGIFAWKMLKPLLAKAPARGTVRMTISPTTGCANLLGSTVGGYKAKVPEAELAKAFGLPRVAS